MTSYAGRPPDPADAPPVEPADLSRALLETGAFAEIIAREAPSRRLLTDAEREQSLRATLDARPAGDVWLFAYGSLIWNPTIHVAERRCGWIVGWHRAFCLSAFAGRGSPDRPGLVLGLDTGGACSGVALRIVEADVERELALLWQREMVSGAYVPRWLEVRDLCGGCFGTALAFTIDRTGCDYAGNLTLDAVVHRLTTAAGSLGSSADYLFRTRDGLRANGLSDAYLEWLAAIVEHTLSAGAVPGVAR